MIDLDVKHEKAMESGSALLRNAVLRELREIYNRPRKLALNRRKSIACRLSYGRRRR